MIVRLTIIPPTAPYLVQAIQTRDVIYLMILACYRKRGLQSIPNYGPTDQRLSKR